MRTTQEAVDLIKKSEGCSLVAYYDGGIDDQGIPHGVLTIGWGHTGNVIEGEQWTQQQADAQLLADIQTIENLVLGYLPGIVLLDNQLSALVSFCFNVGFGKTGEKSGFFRLREGGPSTILSRLLAGDFEGAAAELPKWDKINGEHSSGIHARRLAEQALFLKTEV